MNGAYFDGSDYISVTNTDLGNFGTSNFTIDFWIKTSDTSDSRVYSKGAHSGGQTIIRAATNKSDWAKFYTAGTHGTLSTSGTEYVANNAWHHVAIVRTQTHLKGYVDGEERDSTTD